MPNMFGGDQFHPAYDPREADRVRDDPRQLVIGNDVYRIQDNGSVVCEEVSGRSYQTAVPRELRDHVRRLTGKSFEEFTAGLRK